MNSYLHYVEDKQKLNLRTSSSPIACFISKIQQLEILFLSFHSAQHQNRNAVSSLTILSIRRCVYVHVYATIMDKSLGARLHFCGIFQCTTLYRVGGGRTARNDALF